MNGVAFRIAVLRAHGATDADLPSLLMYTRNHFTTDAGHLALPLPDEPFVAGWEQDIRMAQQYAAWELLRERLIPLRAVRLEQPESIRVFLHATAAGRIPVIITHSRADFVALTHALVHRNQPVPIPASLGAYMLAGKGVQQDRFILLSTGPYSGVRATDVGLDDDAWQATSHTIRLEHECTHYCTRRAFGSMRNALHDELIADYCGIVAGAARFRADWFLRFMGLENFPDYRAGGRMENYRGQPPLSDNAFRVLQSMVYAAAHSLEIWHATREMSSDVLTDRSAAILSLARTDLATLSCTNFVRVHSRTGSELLHRNEALASQIQHRH